MIDKTSECWYCAGEPSYHINQHNFYFHDLCSYHLISRISSITEDMSNHFLLEVERRIFSD